MERLTLRPAEFAEAIGVSRSKGYEILAGNDGPPVVRIGSSIRVPIDGLKEWLARKATTAA